MNRILTLGLAALGTAVLAQPVYADKGGRGGGGGGHGGGGGGGARIAAPAVHSAPAMRSAPAMHFSQRSAPAPKFSAPSQQRFATQAQAQFNNRSAPIAHVRPSTTVSPSVARTRSFSQPQRNAPSIAFGGHAFNNNNNNAIVNERNARTFSSTTADPRFNGRGDARNFRAPSEVTRDWDHGHVHNWNNHRYRWYGNDWVLFDTGVPYGYYGDGGAVYYNDNDNDYDQEPAPALSYDSSQSLAMGVQDRLTRQGYSPGPVDGVVGAQTRDAIADFQNDHNLPVTGQIDAPLLRALGLQ